MVEFNYDRNSGLGASDCPAALGMSKWCTPFELYQIKRGERPPVEESIPMMVGNALEPLVLQLFADEMQVEVTGLQDRIIDPERPWRWATMDGLINPQEGVEAKTTGYAKDWGDGPEDIPLMYMMQTQHQMAVNPDLERIHVPVLIGNSDFRRYLIERDQELIDLLTEQEDRFWQGVIDGTPPDPITEEDVRARWTTDNGEQVPASDIALERWRELKRAKGQLKVVEGGVDYLKLELMKELGENTALLGPDGKPIVTFKKSKDKKAFSATKFKEHNPETYKEFTVTTPGPRAFLVK